MFVKVSDSVSNWVKLSIFAQYRAVLAAEPVL
jgi:hypothetical protein